MFRLGCENLMGGKGKNMYQRVGSSKGRKK